MRNLYSFYEIFCNHNFHNIFLVHVLLNYILREKEHHLTVGISILKGVGTASNVQNPQVMISGREATSFTINLISKENEHPHQSLIH